MTRQRHHQSHLEGHRVPVSILIVLLKNDAGTGACVAQLVNHLPSAQVITTGSWDRVPDGASCLARVCFSLSLCPSHLFVLSLTLSQINKILKKKNASGSIAHYEWG